MRHSLMVLMAAGLSLISITASGAPPEPPSVMTLQQVVERVLRANVGLKARHQGLQAARHQAAAARAARLPRVSVTYRYAHLKDKPYFRLHIPGSPTFPYGGEDEARWGVELFQPIFAGFALVSKERLARLEVDVARLEEETERLDLRLEAQVGYYRCLLAEQGVAVAREAVEALTAHLRDAQAFFRKGLIPKNDLLRSQVALAAARQELVRATARLDEAKDLLNILMDRPVGTPLALAPPPNGTPPLPDLHETIAAALGERPERKRLLVKLKEAEEEKRVARAGRLPQVGMVARYEQVGQDLLADDNAYTNHSNLLVALEARWDLFQFGRHRHLEAAAEYKARELSDLLHALEQSISMEVKRAWLQARVARQNISTAATGLRHARENCRITNLQYREHLATSSDVLDARTFLSQAEMDYHRAFYGYLVALARLQRAVGGSVD